MKKPNKALIGGAMAMNTLPLLKPGANAGTAMNALEGGIGIGVVGIMTDKMFSMNERKQKRRCK